jgi:hypothetical protein
VEIDEAGPGDLDLGDGRRWPAGRRPALRERARIGLARGLGQQHRGIGGEVAVFARPSVARPRSPGEARSAGRVPAARRADDALFDQGAELGFHEGAAVSMAAHCTRGGATFQPALQPPFNAFQPCVVAVEQHLLLGISDGKCAKVLDDRRLPGFKVAGAARQIFKLALDAILPGLEADAPRPALPETSIEGSQASYQPPPRHRQRRPSPIDEVVEQADVDQPQRLLDARGDRAVGGAGSRDCRWGGCGR